MWWRELPAGFEPAFPFSEAVRGEFYPHEDTWEEFTDAVENRLIPQMREKGMTNIQKREIHEVMLEFAAEHPKEIAAGVIEARKQAYQGEY
ncbi:hypothetical protein JMJ58_21195 (plasmid) [Haloterrigena salifodinae]|uniref:Uncharacterized protein n=1 Tax=Haloterrigena salifodinae TaxID=2675099 RepID=A0A8T8E788_9EURY|nr:hypothetical protein [Haloterrigena salifodinae]QRV17473.1 hypothetical protein JMJ58_21195 [Haloterrigena salifodinae]